MKLFRESFNTLVFWNPKYAKWGDYETICVFFFVILQTEK